MSEDLKAVLNMMHSTLNLLENAENVDLSEVKGALVTWCKKHEGAEAGEVEIPSMVDSIIEDTAEGLETSEEASEDGEPLY